MRFRSLFITYSLLFIGCGGKGPIVEVCLLAPDELGAYCTLPSGEQKFRSIAELNEYVATPIRDMQKLLDYCKGKGR